LPNGPATAAALCIAVKLDDDEHEEVRLSAVHALAAMGEETFNRNSHTLTLTLVTQSNYKFEAAASHADAMACMLQDPSKRVR